MAKTFPTKREFRVWLESKRPRAIVGMTVTGRGCPLAKFMEARGASVEIYYHNPMLPKWASDFAERIDNVAETACEVTAGRCLEALR